MPARYHARPDVLFTPLAEDEAVLLDLTSQRYYSLNETGLVLWGRLAAPHTADELRDALCDAYEVDGATALSTVHAFLEELVADGLVVVAAER